MTDKAVAPPRPSRLSLWMCAHGRPSQIRVRQMQTGVDTSETLIMLFVLDDQNSITGSIQVTRDEIGQGLFIGRSSDVHLYVGYDYVVDWTPAGRKKLDDWQTFNFQNKHELEEYNRLKKKFEPGA